MIVKFQDLNIRDYKTKKAYAS